MKYSSYLKRNINQSLLFMIIISLSFLQVKAQKESYSFFIAGHTSGKPGVDNQGIHPPLKDKFEYIQSRPEIKFGIFTGDIVKPNPDSIDWDHVDNDIELLGLPVYFAVGNHDMENRPLFESRYGSTYYSFKYNNDLFIVLDPNLDGWSIKDDQLAFLKSTVQEQCTSSDHIFVFIHQLLWKNNTNIYQFINPNSYAGLQRPINFWTEIIPIFHQLDNQVTFCSGDLGACSYSSDFMYDAFDNITFIASGMGEGPGDNFIILNIAEDKSISYDLICLNEENINCFGDLIDYQLSSTCFPNGISFNSQASIDTFKETYSNCTHLLGDLTISGNDILNLDSLSHLSSVEGSIYITDNHELSSLKGLQNIFHISNNIHITSNQQLNQIHDLSGLSIINGELNFTSNLLLSNLVGLENIRSSLKKLSIVSNPNLSDITSLQNIPSLSSTLEIRNNTLLNDISPLSGIYLNGLDFLIIEDNTQLSNCAINSICNYIDNPTGSHYISNNKKSCNSIDQISAECTSPVADIQMEGLRVFPSPAKDKVQVEYNSKSSGLLSLTVINSMGEKLDEIVIQKQSHVIDVTKYDSGLYFFTIKGEGIILETYKIIIQK